MSGGILERGDIVRGDFVLGGYCPGGYCPGDIVRGDIVLIPFLTPSSFRLNLSNHVYASEGNLFMLYGTNLSIKFNVFYIFLFFRIVFDGSACVHLYTRVLLSVVLADTIWARRRLHLLKSAEKEGHKYTV